MRYSLLKKSKYKRYFLMNMDNSFDMKKKKEKDSIGTIKFYNEKMINQVIQRNIKNGLKKIIELIVSIEEEGDNPDSLLLCLDQTAKFKREIINKYAKYLDKKQIEKVNKKIEIMEKELKNKLIMYTMLQKKSYVSENNEIYDDEYDEEIERHHSR